MKINFKIAKYDDEKGNVIAVDLDSKSENSFTTHTLFLGERKLSAEWLRRKTRNATPKEYLSTLTDLKKQGHQIEITGSLKTNV